MAYPVAAVCVMLVLALVFFFIYFFRRMRNGLLDMMQHMVLREIEYRPIARGEFPRVDREWYDLNRAFLEGEGYRFFADVELMNWRKVQDNPRSFYRVMGSSDCSVSVSMILSDYPPLYRIATSLAGFKKTSIEYSVESEDGRFFMVASSFGQNHMSMPPEMTVHSLEAGLDIESVHVAFETLYAEFIAGNPDFIPLRMLSGWEILDSDKRQYALNAAFRRKVGYFTVEEYIRSGMNPALAHKEVKRLRRELAERGVALDVDFLP